MDAGHASSYGRDYTATVNVANALTVVDIVSLSVPTVHSSTIAQTSGSSLAVGERVTFRSYVQIHAGTHQLTVTFALPTAPGKLSVVSSQVSSVGSAISSISGGQVVGTAGTATDTNTDTLRDRVVFSLGTVVNQPNKADVASHRLEFEVVAMVEDLSAINVNGVSLTTTASLQHTTGTLSHSVAVTIVEPRLTITQAYNARYGARSRNGECNLCAVLWCGACSPVCTGAVLLAWDVIGGLCSRSR